MVKSKNTYEEIRLKRLEENKKRMEELNINKLSHDLHKSAHKPSPVKSRTPRPRQSLDLTAVRRSSRVANNPPLNYSEGLIEPLKMPRRSYQRRDLLNRVYASDELRTYAIERAEQVQSALEPGSPTFIKPMLQSHVTGGFWLGLPQHFCTSHLPGDDEIITLVDEEDNEFPTKYLAHKHGLSGGWRGFAIDHQLVDGDALVFQLVTPTEFKVYIIRAYRDEDADKGEDEKDTADKGEDEKDTDKGEDEKDADKGEDEKDTADKGEDDKDTADKGEDNKDTANKEEDVTKVENVTKVEMSGRRTRSGGIRTRSGRK